MYIYILVLLLLLLFILYIYQDSAEQVAVEAAEVLAPELWVQLHHLVRSIEEKLTSSFQQPHFEVVAHLENLTPLLATQIHRWENLWHFQKWS